MTRNSYQFLRPCLSKSFQPFTRPEHARIYCALQRRFAGGLSNLNHRHVWIHDVEKKKRLVQLQNARPLESYHPPIKYDRNIPDLSPKEFAAKYKGIEGLNIDEMVSVFGRVRSVRRLGSKLIFVDIERENQRVQAMVDVQYLNLKETVDENDWKGFKQVVRNGDWISVKGYPTKTKTGELSILAKEVPRMLAPCLHHIPERIEDPETLARRPHVHQLVDREPGDIMRLRGLIYEFFRSAFLQDGFLEVETPMFDAGAGGAIARPFETVANEMSNTPIKLRIAPELPLKRLVIGGQDKIFELGRVFRNEGIDNTHNPEFTICEFYQVGATLTYLINRTEKLFINLAKTIDAYRAKDFPSLTAPDNIKIQYPFARLTFIPTIEKAINRSLPDLSSDNAVPELLSMFQDLDIPIPPQANLPRLLDALAEKYIEPLCKEPTFITHHPEALSPLSKSFVDVATGQRVASRIELFIDGREYVNAYEEENSPFEQRRKFEQQLSFHPESSGTIDESYIEALEWGMPPTGGWGCGLDRLVMLFAGKKRIADVLPFGTLRNVVSISKNGQGGI